MHRDEQNIARAKDKIAQNLIALNSLATARQNAYFLQLFMQTKSDEIVDIFSTGPRPSTDINTLKNTLKKIYPTYAGKWNKIKK